MPKRGIIIIHDSYKWYHHESFQRGIKSPISILLRLLQWCICKQRWSKQTKLDLTLHTQTTSRTKSAHTLVPSTPRKCWHSPSLRMNCHHMLPHLSQSGCFKKKKINLIPKKNCLLRILRWPYKNESTVSEGFLFFPTSWDKNSSKILIAFISIFKRELLFILCCRVTYVREIYIFLKEGRNPGEWRVCQGTIMSWGGRGRRRGREGRSVPSKAGGCSLSSIRLHQCLHSSQIQREQGVKDAGQ